MPRKKSSKNQYFDQRVNDAIVSYKNSDNKITRDKLFNLIIYPALNKLVENVIHTWKFHNYESTYQDLKHETVVYLYEQLDKYKPETGSKAFSYFTIITRNYLIKKYKEYKIFNNITSDLLQVDLSRNIPLEMSKHNDTDLILEYLSVWCDYVVLNLDDIFKTEKEKAIAKSFIHIIDNSYDIDIFNKKIIYIYIREQLGIDNTLMITKVMKILKECFKRGLNDYIKYGIIQKYEVSESIQV